MQRAGTHWKWMASAGFVWCVALFSILLMPVLAGVALILCVISLMRHLDWELCVAGILVISGLFVAGIQVTRSLLVETRSHLPDHPDTYRNAHLLPMEETLMRSSDFPLEQQQELLRPVAEQTIPPEQLLRAYPPEQIHQRTYTLRQNRQDRAARDPQAGLADVFNTSNGNAFPSSPETNGKARHYESDQ
ncbi:MAG: hypothetical protein JWN14_4659 [Chthonomonadales bacterium]|nr:hypothetical protein [Chthonomonadales bacterium]